MSKIIFISGRFRSGTSMLWNIFNQLPQYCAYYEPLHPNLMSHIKYVKPKQDHLGIDDYWQNYSQLKDIDQYYSSSFGQYRLYLEKHEEWKELEQYIRFLISNAGDKTPVLQFNRVDLKLSWLKNTFPEATIIHLKRDVYPLWISSRKHLKTNQEKNNESHPDAYDLMQWSADLAVDFPMLQKDINRSSYFRHCFIWKLSNKLAKAHADIHLNLESNFLHTTTGIDILSKKFNWDMSQIDNIKELIQKPKSIHNTITKSDYFLDIENSIDKLFKQLGLEKYFPSSPLNEIKIDYKKQWDQYPLKHHAVIQELITALSFQKDELTALVN